MRKTDLTYLVEILSKHLKTASVHFRMEELQLCLLSSPMDITALSIVQTYTCLGAKASVFRADYASTIKWGKPFLGQLSHDGKDSFVFVKEITETDAIYYEGRLKRVVSASDFKKEWTGIVVAIDNVKERNQEKKRLKTFIHSSLLLCISGIAFNQFTFVNVGKCQLLIGCDGRHTLLWGNIAVLISLL